MSIHDLEKYRFMLYYTFVNRFKIIPKNRINGLPKTSGVYCFYGLNPKPSTLNPIYIGKAINIQSRVKSHFQQPSYRDNLFIDKVEKIGFIETNSEIEALILEANLIKKYQPKFNVVWKDDKNYFWVAVLESKNRIPYVFVTHQPKLISNFKFQISNSQYIGPFVEGTALKNALKFLRRVFPYYTSAKHPKGKCTWCHLGLCPGPELFENPSSPKASARLREYRRNIKKLILILQGKSSAVLNSLKREMTNLSKENKFEEAAKIRDKISSLQQVMSHKGVIQSGGMSDVPPAHKIECYDVSNIQGKFATGSMVVFVDGKPDKNQYRKFKIKLGDTPNDIAMLKEVLERRFNHKEWKYPEMILIDGGKAQLNVAIKAKGDLNIKVISIAKGKQELFIQGRQKPIPLNALPREIYNLILQLDDEAHRFAITYHKNLRKSNLLQ